jgi:hypothetical protein
MSLTALNAPDAAVTPSAMKMHNAAMSMRAGGR